MQFASSTTIATASECWRKWYYNYVLMRGKPPSEAMLRGSTFHKIAELFYGDGMSLEDIHDYIQENHPDYAPFLGIATTAFTGYLERYGEDIGIVTLDDGTKAVETEFSLYLADDILIKGKLDYLSERGSKKYINDWKVTGMYLSDHYFSSHEMNFQAKLYSYVAQEYFGDIDGFIIDAVMARQTKFDFKRQFFPLLPNREEFIQEVYAIVCYMRDNKHDEENFPHCWTSCTTKFGRCPFFEVCRLPARRRHDLLFSDEFVEYKPLYEEERKFLGIKS